MLTSHRIRLDPNNVQRTRLVHASGVARFAYNWALAEWGKQYEAYKADPSLKPPNEAALRRKLNALKYDQFPWMLEVTKCAPQMAIIKLGRAFENFFAGHARYPKFRCKGIDDRFTITNDQVKIDGQRIQIPKLGWVRMREAMRFTGHIISASVSRTAEHWYVSLIVDCPDRHPSPVENQGSVGVDLGILHLATLSTAETIDEPRALQRLLCRVQHLSRLLSRKVRGSRNYVKAKRRLSELHEHIANLRRDGLHQLTTGLTRRFHTIGIEDLNVRGMLKNRRLARAIANMGFGELRRQLLYKSARNGGHVVVVDRWYPSSKTCSSCGHVLQKLKMKQRSWTCPDCGVLHDRDVNAAINLRAMAVSSTVTACGGEGAGLSQKREAKPAPVKQESNSEVSSGWLA